MKERDQRIVDAVLRKAEVLCPGSLELLGVYGSALTGDDYEKSDVDLLIVSDDEGGRLLTDAFILEDTCVGYDLYRTRWESLEEDAGCPHAHLSKLMDARIVYCRDGAAAARLEGLRQKAAGILASDARLDKARALFATAEREYAETWFTEDLSEVRTHAGEAVYRLLDALMLFHGRYFRLGTKRTFEEMAALELPFDAEKAVMDVLTAGAAETLRPALTSLFLSVKELFQRPEEKAPPTAEALAGTYEEMVSNWRNKMTEAARHGDVFSSFMNLGSLQVMLHELAADIAIRDREIMGRFQPEDLWANVETFDAALEAYAREYAALGLPVRRYAGLEEFLATYLPEAEEGSAGMRDTRLSPG